jgi:hypothetical protein
MHNLPCEYPVPAPARHGTDLVPRCAGDDGDISVPLPTTNLSGSNITPSPQCHDADALQVSMPESWMDQLPTAPSTMNNSQAFLSETMDSTICISLLMCYGSDGLKSSPIHSPLRTHLPESTLHMPNFPNQESIPPRTKHSMEYFLRVLRTWPCMMAREMQLPPIFHQSHDAVEHSPPALTNCLKLTKTWYRQNAESSEIFHESVIMEIETISSNVNFFKTSMCVEPSNMALVLDL